jgi:hypothetical protein
MAIGQVVLDQQRPKTTILRFIHLWLPNCAPTLRDVGLNPIAAKILGTLAQQMFIWPFSLQRNDSFFAAVFLLEKAKQQTTGDHWKTSIDQSMSNMNNELDLSLEDPGVVQYEP